MPPEGWEIKRSKKRDMQYYLNTSTGERYWKDAALPMGWGLDKTKKQKMYVLLATGERTAIKPSGNGGVNEKGEDLGTSTQRMTFTFKEPGPFGIRFDRKGVVTKVEAGGQAEALGFMDHDTIVEVAGVATNERTLVPNLKALGRPGA